MTFKLILFIIFINFFQVSAQIPTLTLEQLTTREGLPSNDIWCLKKDKKGFLWLGTGRSICRYDGYTFQSPDNKTFGYCSGISIDSSGLIYASVSSEGLCAINPNTQNIQTILPNNYEDSDKHNDMFERVFVDSRNQVWLCDYTSVKRYDPAKKQLKTYPLSPLENVHQDASFFEDSHGNFWVVSEIGLYRYDRQRDRLVCLLGLEAVIPKNKIPIRLEIASEDDKGYLWIGAYDSGLIRFSPEDASFTFHKKGFEDQNVICGQQSVDENQRKLFFIGTEKGLSIYYPDEDKVYHLPDFYKKGIHVRNMLDDKINGILWIGTREGLYKYRYRNPGIRTIDIPGNVLSPSVEITSPLQMPDGSYLLGLSRFGALALNLRDNKFKLQRYPQSTYTNQLRLIGNKPMAFTDRGIFVSDPASGKFSSLSEASRLFSSTEFIDGLIDKKGRLWIANLTGGLKVLDPVTKKEIKLWPDSISYQLTHNNFIKAIVEGADGKIWIGTCPNGLYYFQESSQGPESSKFIDVRKLLVNKEKSLSGLCINALKLSRDGSILVASWGGVNKISERGEILLSFNDHDNLRDTYCRNICEDKTGNIWFSTSEGIHIANPKTRKIKYLSTNEGLYNNHSVGFLKTQTNELVLGYPHTLNIVNIDGFKNNAIPNVYISSVEVKGKALQQDLTKEILLEPEENAITFAFSTLNFEPNSKNLFSYKLVGFEEKWVDLGNQHMISFTNLAAKSYTLLVKGSNNFGQESKKPLVLHFTVKPHFTDTWLFKVLLALCFGGIIVGLMRWRVSTLDERNRLDLQVTEWRLKALQSQMNPHFLFNSLNSVQNYLLNNRGIEGAKYLSKFSKLVRRIMENSNHQYLSFEKIIETLKMYVEIESFRFNYEFSYSFDIEDNDLLLDAPLPPMLLQPYVENAIWHGLMPKDGEKSLKISARIDQNHIVCLIEDNGVGRGFSPRKEGHISRGQEMTKGIFESLKHKDASAKIEIIDLFDSDNNPAGTQVRMRIPL